MGKKKIECITIAIFAIAILLVFLFSVKIIFAAEEEENFFPNWYILDPKGTLQKKSEDKKKSTIQSDDFFLGLSNDTWSKLSYCASSVAIGYGAKSGNTGMISGGALIFGITLYYDSKKSLLDQVSWGDIGVGVLCGSVGYYVAPKKKPELSNPPPSSNPPPPSNPPPQSGPGPDPPFEGNPGGNPNGSGSDPAL